MRAGWDEAILQPQPTKKMRKKEHSGSQAAWHIYLHRIETYSFQNGIECIVKYFTPLSTPHRTAQHRSCVAPGIIPLFIKMKELFSLESNVYIMKIGRIWEIFSGFLHYSTPFFILFSETVRLVLFLSTPILCAYSYYEFWVNYYC